MLVERFLGGDTRAFEDLYSKYYEKVFAIARGVLMDSDEAADAVQEIFTLVYRHLGRFDKRSRFSTWLTRYRSRTVALTEAITKATPEEPDTSDPRVQATMIKLAPADRALLVLFYWEELSLQDIGDSIGCGVNAAKTRLYRARERFRVIYEATP